MTVDRPVNRTHQILTVVIVMLAVRALFGEPIAAFMDGMYLGFTDGV